MTMTNDERREVAQELRKLAAPGCIRYAEEFYEELREIVAFDLDGSFGGVANSLADLIDRPTCHVTSRPGNDENDVCDSCSVCGFGWHKSRFDPPYRYCPKCGARVVEKEEDE